MNVRKRIRKVILSPAADIKRRNCNRSFSFQPVEKVQQKVVQLRDFVIPEKFGIVVFCGYAVFLSI